MWCLAVAKKSEVPLAIMKSLRSVVWSSNPFFWKPLGSPRLTAAHYVMRFNAMAEKTKRASSTVGSRHEDLMVPGDIFGGVNMFSKYVTSTKGTGALKWNNDINQAQMDFQVIFTSGETSRHLKTLVNWSTGDWFSLGCESIAIPAKGSRRSEFQTRFPCKFQMPQYTLITCRTVAVSIMSPGKNDLLSSLLQHPLWWGLSRPGNASSKDWKSY